LVTPVTTPQPVPYYVKDPSAVLDYVWDWSADDDPYLADGETISTATVTVPTGITKNSTSNTTTTVTAWLSAGTVDTDYRVVCQIVTSAARTDERSIIVQVRQR
jgi:dUTPase